MSEIEVAKRVPFSVTINRPDFQKAINNTIQDPNRRARFISAIVSAVTVNQALQECTPQTILSGALLGESLNLSPSPQLGQYYLVPFKDKKNNCTNAVFTLGYKGMIQLALRSGQYKRLNVMSIKDGELLAWNPLTEEIKVRLIEDESELEKAPTIGYTASFECLNGFTKTIYWSKEKMISHADRYSAAFSKEATSGRYPKVSFADYEAHNYPGKDEWLYSSFWYRDFDGMAHKTMLRQLISKWGIMSIDLQTALEKDTEAEQAEYFEAPELTLPPVDPTEIEPQRVADGPEKQVSLSDV